MYMIYGKIRDYDYTADTASVEMEGLGGIDFWLDNVKIDASLNRALLTHNFPVILGVPDEWRLPEAMIMSYGAAASAAYAINANGVYTTTYGRGLISTNGSGIGTVNVGYGHTYSLTPKVSIAGDNGITVLANTVTTTGFTATVSGGPINGFQGFSWEAEGN